jgi:hypothetical protein
MKKILPLFFILTLAVHVLADGPVYQISPFMQPVLKSQNSAAAQSALGFAGGTVGLSVVTNVAAGQATLIVSNNFNTNVLAWTQLDDTNKAWVYLEDIHGTLWISNIVSKATYSFDTNGDLTLNSTNNLSLPAYLQMDQSQLAYQGNGIWGDDIMHINGQTAILELGGTGTPFWNSLFGFLPSWIFTKDGNFGGSPYTPQDLSFIPHVNGGTFLPFQWAVEIGTNGTMNVWSNLTDYGWVYVGQGEIISNTLTVNNTLTTFDILMNANGAQAYKAVSSVNNVYARLQVGNQDFWDEGINEANTPGEPANVADWQIYPGKQGVGEMGYPAMGCTTNGDLYTHGAAEIGGNLGVAGNVTNALHMANGAGCYATGALPWTSGGTTNLTATNFCIIQATGHFFITNVVTHWSSPFDSITTPGISPTLEPNQAIWDTSADFAELTNYPTD